MKWWRKWKMFDCGCAYKFCDKHQELHKFFIQYNEETMEENRRYAKQLKWMLKDYRNE